MQSGVNVDAYRSLAERGEIPVIASGGVSASTMFARSPRSGRRIEGAIVGTALYEQRSRCPRPSPPGVTGEGA
jgi:phosphoribosylformimino-5-aminoimidazole carboxamide ribotide isomerase